MAAWLQNTGTHYEANLTKVELYMLIQANKPKPVYHIDGFLESEDHSIIHLLPYHCDLNPLERVWSTVTAQNFDQRIQELETLVQESVV